MIIAPSVLSLDFSQLEYQMKQLNESKAKWIHFDVMDGHFVDNLTFGPDILKGMKKISNHVFDVHLMVTRPDLFAPVFIAAGANILTFHYEAIEGDKIGHLIDEIHNLNCKVGLSIVPQTPIEVLYPFLENIDLVLVMAVKPGFGGQSFDPMALDKIKWLNDYKIKHNASFLIEVDGGINKETAKLVKAAGAQVLVSGSYIFNSDIVQQIESLI